MTAPESLLQRTIGLGGELNPFHFQICRVGVCNGAAQVSERLGCLQWFIVDRNHLWQLNGHWRKLVEQLGLGNVDLKTKTQQLLRRSDPQFAAYQPHCWQQGLNHQNRAVL